MQNSLKYDVRQVMSLENGLLSNTHIIPYYIVEM